MSLLGCRLNLTLLQAQALTSLWRSQQPALQGRAAVSSLTVKPLSAGLLFLTVRDGWKGCWFL